MLQFKACTVSIPVLPLLPALDQYMIGLGRPTYAQPDRAEPRPVVEGAPTTTCRQLPTADGTSAVLHNALLLCISCHVIVQWQRLCNPNDQVYYTAV